MDKWLKKNLVCPRDHASLEVSGASLICENGHRYPYVNGIPVMLLEEARPTHEVFSQTLEAAAAYKEDDGTGEHMDTPGHVDPYVQRVVGATCGIMYRDLIDSLTSYPIPELRMPPADGKYFLDIGCNWGRWTISAAKKGYIAVGIDPSLASIQSAGRVAKQMGLSPYYVVADSRYLPFASAAFDVVFSYSVLQHLVKPDVRTSLVEASRVLKESGVCLVQLPNRYGLRNIYNQMRLLFKEQPLFGIHYWRPSELIRVFGETVGPSTLSVDGFFSLNAQKSDVHLLPRRYRLVVNLSETLRKMSDRIKWMAHFADSLYVTSIREASDR